MKVHLLNKLECRRDVKPLVHYAILFWGEEMVDLSTAECRNAYTQQRKSKNYQIGSEVKLSDITGTLGELEAAGGAKFKERYKTAYKELCRPQ